MQIVASRSEIHLSGALLNDADYIILKWLLENAGPGCGTGEKLRDNNFATVEFSIRIYIIYIHFAEDFPQGIINRLHIQ